jgi:hypothetical protein
VTLERATLDQLGAVAETPHPQTRRAAALILAAGLGDALDDLGADGCVRCPEIAREDAREVAQMLGLLPSPPPRELTKARRAESSEFMSGRPKERA